MNSRIQQVTQHIESHLLDELDVTQLASIANYSKFHFCRAFKAQMGESVMAYIQRLRIEAASQELGIGNKPLIDVAYDIGFQTPTGFLKAFKKRFGMTPSDYKQTTKKAIQTYRDITMENPEIIKRDITYIVFHRALGDYFTSSGLAWKHLQTELDALEEKYKNSPPTDTIAFDIKHAEYFGIYFDDPDVTEEKNIRYDACIAWSKDEIDFLKSEGFNTKTITAGKYAKVLHKGDYESIDDSWYGLYAWIEKHSYELKDEPTFARYVNTPDDVEVADLLTEIYVPIDA